MGRLDVEGMGEDRFAHLSDGVVKGAYDGSVVGAASFIESTYGSRPGVLARDVEHGRVNRFGLGGGAAET